MLAYLFVGTCAGIGSSSKGDLGLAQWQVHVTTNGVTSVTTPATCEAYLAYSSSLNVALAATGLNYTYGDPESVSARISRVSALY